MPAVSFGGSLADARPLPAPSTAVVPAVVAATGESRARHGAGRDDDWEDGRELATFGPRRLARRTRPSDEDEEEVPKRTRRSMPLWQELPLLLVVAFCLAVLIRTFLLQAFFIPSGSMEQTLLVGDRVLVNKIVYDVRQPERGEVVVFRGTDNWGPENFDAPPTSLIARIGRTLGDLVGVSRPGEKDFIKRVIAVPGDRISCCDPAGRVYVNGKGIDEPYVINNSPLDVPPDPRVCRSRRFDEVLVPPGQIFVMGDHRIVSQDARCQGPVPIENVIGRAFVIVWPSSRWDTLGVPDTFKDVPPPVALGPPGGAGVEMHVGAAVVTLPILASLVVTRRSGRKPRWGRRTLRR
jgi:signal peptidase I